MYRCGACMQSVDASKFLKVLVSQRCSNDWMISISRRANTIQIKAPRKLPRHQERLLIRDVVFCSRICQCWQRQRTSTMLRTKYWTLVLSDSAAMIQPRADTVLKCSFWICLGYAVGTHWWILLSDWAKRHQTCFCDGLALCIHDLHICVYIHIYDL